jgi:hypothetical protein
VVVIVVRVIVLAIGVTVRLGVGLDLGVRGVIVSMIVRMRGDGFFRPLGLVVEGHEDQAPGIVAGQAGGEDADEEGEIAGRRMAA